MSTGKRLAKRSILGTRVVVPGEDGLYLPAVIQAVKTGQDQPVTSRYSVRFDLTRKVREYPESDIIGPGFAGLTGLKLRPGQIVYVTYCNREMQGSVVCHRPNIDQVIVRLLNGGPEVKKKLEEVRLLESRKSARLIGHGNTDFSKLADFNIVHERKRLNSETSDMSSGTTSGRKRRGSDTLSDSSDEGEYAFSWSSSEERSATPVMSECTAAMVLMNLSHAQMASKEVSAMQQRMMQFMHRGSGSNSHAAANAAAAAAAEAVVAAAEDTQNSPQDLSTTSILSTVPSSSRSHSGATPLSLAASSTGAATPAQYASADSPPILDGSSSPMSSTSGASSLGSSWTPRGQLQPSPPTNGGDNRATPTSHLVSQQQVANLTEAEALLQLSNCQESDEGIVSDQSSVTDPEDPTARRSKTEHVRIIYQCTWPRCGIKMDICSDMERHVRSQHLMKSPAPNEDLEGEEEFYYTEIEVPLTVTSDFAMLLGAGSVCRSGNSQQTVASLAKSLFSTSAPASVQAAAVNVLQSCLPSNLSDHMDMARPPHENPEYNFAHQSSSNPGVATVAIAAAANASQVVGVANNGVSHAPPTTGAATGVSVIPRPSPAHHQPRRPLNYPPLPPPATAFSSITAAVPIAIPVTNLAFSRSAPPAHSSSHPHGLHHTSHHSHHSATSHNGHHSAASGAPGSGKYIRLSPKPNTSSTQSSMRTPSSPASAAAMASLSNSLLTLHQQSASMAHPQPPGPPGPPGPPSGPPSAGPPPSQQSALANGPVAAASGTPMGSPAGVPPIKSSPIRRPRGDAKKCRKVYGMDHRDLWCTQCKWKKACTRFGEGT